MTAAASTNALSLPIYARKPQRRIPGTDAIAVTVYASGDRTVRHYTLFTTDGVRLGDVSNHSKRLGVAAGYHQGHGSFNVCSGQESWSNLTDAATALASK